MYRFVKKLAFWALALARANQGILGCLCNLYYDVVAFVLFLTIGIFKVFILSLFMGYPNEYFVVHC